MSVFGPPADAERRARQRRALAVLADLLTEDLPVMQWSLNPGADLMGRPAAADPAGRREAFDAWVARLGAHEWTPVTSGGMTRLHAVCDRYRDVRIGVGADILDEPRD